MLSFRRIPLWIWILWLVCILVVLFIDNTTAWIIAGFFAVLLGVAIRLKSGTESDDSRVVKKMSMRDWLVVSLVLVVVVGIAMSLLYVFVW